MSRFVSVKKKISVLKKLLFDYENKDSKFIFYHFLSFYLILTIVNEIYPNKLTAVVIVLSYSCNCN